MEAKKTIFECKQRDTSIDIAKGMLIYCVVAGHISGWPYGSGGFFYLFHLQAFFFISGYLFNYNKYKDSFISLLRGRKKLYTRYLLYMIAFIIAHNLLVDNGLVSATITKYSTLIDYAQSTLKSFIVPVEELSGALWFIPALIIMQSIFFVLKRISSRFQNGIDIEILIITAMFIYGVSQLSEKNYTWLDFRYIVFMPFFYAGYLCRGIDISKTNNPIIIAACFLFLMYCLYTKVDLYNYYEINPYELLSVSTTGIVFILGLSFFINGSFLSKHLSFVGERTVHILALHFLCFKIVTYAFVLLGYSDHESLNNLAGGMSIIPLSPIIYLIVGVNVPVIANMLYQKLSRIISQQLSLRLEKTIKSNA